MARCTSRGVPVATALLLAATVSASALLIGTASAQLAGADGGNGGNAAGATAGAGGAGGLAGDGSFTGGSGGTGGYQAGGSAGGGPAGGATGPAGQGTGTGGGPDSGGGGGRTETSANGAAGGGGGGGGRGATVATNLNNTTTIAGGKGGNGGNGAGGSDWTGGGGGGGGGAGVVLDGTAITNSGTITGGSGGNGGVGAGGGYSASLDDGTGGTGGSGIVVNTTTGATITNSGTIQGGNGGLGNGPQGAAGVGISGQNLTIVNSGTIAAGAGSGSIDALRFTGGSNTLTMTGATSGLTGNIAIQAGSLTFAQGTDVTVANAIIGAGAIAKTGAGTLTLTGTNTYSGGTTVSAGMLKGTTASIRGALTNNAAVVFNHTTAGTFAGAISGSGSLAKEGSGNLTLSGVNTSTGPIFVKAGTLTATGGNAIGNASRLTIDSGATLAIAQSETIGALSGVAGAFVTIASGQSLATQTDSAANFAGTISGSGRLTKQGGGTLTLTGNNTLTGNTTISAGTLQIGDGGTSGSVAGNVENNGALVFNRSDSVSMAGQISGSGSLTKTGSGTLTLTGTNTYSGGTTVSAGTLIGNTTSLRGPIVNNAAVVFDQVGNGNFSGTISGSGSLSKLGAGTLTLSGANSYLGTTFVNAGTLLITGGQAIADTGRVVVANGATLDVAQSETIGFLSGVAGSRVAIGYGHTLTTSDNSGSDFAGTISGSGSLKQNFSGTTTLSGTSTYTGPTSVTTGTLAVNGSIASSSSVTVGAGATLAGSGQLPSTVVNGILSPGNSPGTLTVNGNLTLNAGSLYIAEVQGAVADRVNVTGTASLAGTLRLVPLGGAYLFGNAYTLLSAQGGSSGTFGTIDRTGSFGDGVTSTVSYTANDVQLTLTAKPLVPITTSQPTTPQLGVRTPLNAYAVASAIDGAVASGVNPSSLFGIYNLPAAAIPAAVNQLSGEAHTAAPAMAVSAASQFLRTMLDPTAAGRIGDITSPATGAAAFSGMIRKGVDAPVPPQFARYAVWGATFGSTGRMDGDARIGSARQNLDDAHIAVGADIRLMPGTVAGFAVSGGSTRASLAGGLGKAEADAFQAGLYGMTRLGPVNLAAALGYARLETDVNRTIPALGSSLSSSYASTAWSGRLQASAAVFNLNGFTVSPLAAVQAVHVRSPGVTEANWTGNNAGALTLARRTDITTRSELGLRLDSATVLGNVPVKAYLQAAWAHYFQRDAGLDAALSGVGGASFAITGAQPDRNVALIAAGLEGKLSERISLGLRLDSELSGNTKRYGGTAQLRVSF